ncbi:MAG: hemerythrin domain-containing protein [Zetaproteobacteria bacterium]|nr:MAG: hemerythrin domain-containing protein [Zetaproteobacteria bacterium]
MTAASSLTRRLQLGTRARGCQPPAARARRATGAAAQERLSLWRSSLSRRGLMPALIQRLKGQHAALKQALAAFQRHPNREDQMKLLAAMKERLLAHLQLEDKELYPFLRAQAERDPELKKMLEMFDEDMRQVSGLVQAFFVRYEGGWDNDYEFLMDLGEVSARLAHRIEVEEKHLYPEYLARKANPTRKLKRGILDRLRALFGG